MFKNGPSNGILQRIILLAKTLCRKIREFVSALSSFVPHKVLNLWSTEPTKKMHMQAIFTLYIPQRGSLKLVQEVDRK
jgi:hypothetical protein